MYIIYCVEKMKGGKKMKTIKQAKWCYIICSVLLIAAGVYIMVRPYASAIIFCRVIGAVSLFYGVSKILGYFSHDLYNLAFQFDLALGVFTLIFGLILLLRSARVVAFMPAILGVFVLVDGVFKLQTAVDAKRFGLSNWWLILLGSLICALFGLLLIIDPFSGNNVLMTFVGLSLAIDGLQNLFNAFYTVKILKNK